VTNRDESPGLLPDPIGRHLDTILEEGNPPADGDYFEQWLTTELQVAIPGKRHKNVGDSEQKDRRHGNYVALIKDFVVVDC
jgi:hypothetical protein